MICFPDQCNMNELYQEINRKGVNRSENILQSALLRFFQTLAIYVAERSVEKG